jgi:hypothetical protein
MGALSLRYRTVVELARVNEANFGSHGTARVGRRA